jgi:hypothetical protein
MQVDRSAPWRDAVVGPYSQGVQYVQQPSSSAMSTVHTGFPHQVIPPRASGKIKSRTCERNIIRSELSLLHGLMCAHTPLLQAMGGGYAHAAPGSYFMMQPAVSQPSAGEMLLFSHRFSLE